MSEAETFLIDFHSKFPSCTPTVFSDGKTGDGFSSYDLLASVIPDQGSQPISILDLACGDGFLLTKLIDRKDPLLTLIGIDMSSDELNVARRRFSENSITLIEGKAQSIPLQDNSNDFVLCHMAFMLMEDIEQVVQEVFRILRPGGVFSFVVGAKGRNGDIYDRFLEKLKEELKSDNKSWLFRLGDRRIRSEDGIRSLFNSRFEQPIEIFDFTLKFSVSPESAVQFFMLMYDIGLLSTESQSRLAENLLQSFRGSVDPSGNVHFENSLRQITCKKVETLETC